MGLAMATSNNIKGGNKPSDPSRRNLIKGAGLVGAAVASSASHVVTAQSPASQSVEAQVTEALETLTAAEAATLEAITDRILPADENGPGAREARAVHYIDRSLASDNAAFRANYGVGLAMIDEYSVKQHGQSFHRLTSPQQDDVLADVIAGEIPGFNPSGGGFFNMIRSHTIEGTFSDPYYGGNRDFIGWDMLGYPGVRFGVSSDEVSLGRDLPPAQQSAYDMPNFTKVIARSGGSGNGN